jgi:phosphinothricin acetyltransferase
LHGSSGIRLAAASDGAAIAAIYRPNVEAAAISFETEPPDAAEMRRRIGNTFPVWPWLVYEAAGHIAGYAYATQHRARAAYQWSVDTSAYVDPSYRRVGIGHGLYLSLCAILAAQGYVNAYAGIALPNPASVGLHERVGFTPVGVYRNVGYKLGAWRDVGWWQLRLQAHDAPPQPIQALTTIQTRADWNALLARGMTVIRAEG